MADRLSPADLEKIQAVINADPRVQAIIRDASLDGRTKMYRLAALSSQLGLPESYGLDTSGRVVFNDGVDWTKWLIPATAIGTMGVYGVMSGGAAAASGGGSAASGSSSIPTIPSTVYGNGMGVSPSLAGYTPVVAANSTPAVAGMVPPTDIRHIPGTVGGGIGGALGGGSIWSRLAPQLVGAGIQGFGSYMQSRAANQAAQQQMAASERALDFSKGIYNDQKANQQPFIGMGHSAVNTLGGLMGLSQPPAPQGNTAQPRGPLSSLGGDMVQMRAPDGSVRMVPANQATYLEARGAQRI